MDVEDNRDKSESDHLETDENGLLTLKEFSMKVNEFDRPLAKFFNFYKIKYELDDGHVIIHLVPANAHSRAVAAWSTVIEMCGNNDILANTQEPAVQNTGDASIAISLSFTNIVLSLVPIAEEVSRFVIYTQGYWMPTSKDQT